MTAPTAPNWLRLGATVAAGRLRPPVGSSRRRTVCGAARVLTGLGVRVEVRAPATVWPRTGTGLLLVSTAVTALDPLALLTAVPGAAVAGVPDRLAGVPVPAVPAAAGPVAALLRAGTTVAVRAAGGPGDGRVDPALLAAAAGAGAAVCPVALRWRGTASPPPAVGSTVAAVRWLAASPGAVVEVHLLPALSSSGATAEELATAAEHAVAAVPETGARPEHATGGGQRGPSPTR